MPLEKEMPTHSIIAEFLEIHGQRSLEGLPGKSMDRGAWRAAVHSSHKRVRHGSGTKQQKTNTPWRKTKTGY